MSYNIISQIPQITNPAIYRAAALDHQDYRNNFLNNLDASSFILLQSIFHSATKMPV